MPTPEVTFFGIKLNIMLRHDIYVDTICLCSLHGWSSESHQSNLSLKRESFLPPQGCVRIKEQAFPASLPLAFTITAITSLRKEFFHSPPNPPSHFAMSRGIQWEIFCASGRISCPNVSKNNIFYLVLSL